MVDAVALDPPTAFARTLYERATLEVTARDTDAAAVLQEHLPRGARVHVTYLSNGGPDEIVTQATALARAGFEPIPHVAARSLVSVAELKDYLARLVGEAAATRVLLVAGDLPKPRGPFASSLDLLRAGALEGGGIRSVGVASHPEGHPAVSAEVMEAALKDKLAYAAASGLESEIVTQFCFEAAPILDHIAHLRMIGVTAPVRIGLAAPTNPALLMKFALRCGVGASLRALSTQAGRMGKLMDAAGPEQIIADLARQMPATETSVVQGLHFFAFGGVKKAAAWLEARRLDATKAGDSPT